MAEEKQRKLNYRFHDPNPAEAVTGYILGILIQANQGKVEAAIRAAGEKENISDAVMEDDSA